MKEELLGILVDIFKSSGYNVTISSPSDIVVERNGYRTFVRCALQPDYEEIKAFSRQMEKSTGIYVTPRKVTAELNGFAERLGVYVWDGEELALQIGKAVLLNIEKKAIKPGISEERNRKSQRLPVEETWQEESVVENVAGSKPGLVPLEEMETYNERADLKTTPDANTPRIKWEMRDKEEIRESEQVETPDTDSCEILNIKSVEPKISKQQAINLARTHLSNPKDAVLKFVPYWKYDYSVDAEKRIKTKILSIVGEGGGYLNALNKAKEEIEIDVKEMEVPTRVPAVVYEVKRPLTDKKQAEKSLMDSIIEENTREMRFNNTAGQAIIYEQKSIKPHPEDIELQVELVYVPVWEVKGKRNSLEINAFNAQVLEEPVDEDAEFL